MSVQSIIRWFEIAKPETYQAPELEPFLTRNKGDQNES